MSNDVMLPLVCRLYINKQGPGKWGRGSGGSCVTEFLMGQTMAMHFDPLPKPVFNLIRLSSREARETTEKQ